MSSSSGGVPDPFGAPKEIISSSSQVSPTAIEELAQLIEQRGLRTPLANVVGYQQLKASSSSMSAGGVAVTTTSTSWTTTGLGNPITALRAGQYLAWMFAILKNSSLFDATTLGLRLNSTDPYAAGAGVHSFGGLTVGVEAAVVGAVFIGVSTLYPFTLTGEASTVTPIWTVSGGTGSIQQHVITLLRLGSVPGAAF